MKSKRWIWAAAAALALVLLAALVWPRPGTEPDETMPAASQNATPAPSASAQASARPAPGDPTLPPLISEDEFLSKTKLRIIGYGPDHPLSPVERDFLDMVSVRDFVAKFQAQALKGHGESQYYLGKALALCFSLTDKPVDQYALAKAEALDKNSPHYEWSRARYLEAAAHWQRRCGGVAQDSMGLYLAQTAWTYRAANSGYPPAQSEWAWSLSQGFRDLDPSFHDALPPNRLAAMQALAGDQLRRAVLSRDPRALAQVAGAVFYGHERDAEDRPLDPAPVDGLAWAMLAERLGGDVSGLRSQIDSHGLSLDQRSAADRRSKDLESLLRSGDWDAVRQNVLYRSYGLSEFPAPASIDLSPWLERLGAMASDCLERCADRTAFPPKG